MSCKEYKKKKEEKRNKEKGKRCKEWCSPSYRNQEKDIKSKMKAYCDC